MAILCLEGELDITGILWYLAALFLLLGRANNHRVGYSEKPISVYFGWRCSADMSLEDEGSEVRGVGGLELVQSAGPELRNINRRLLSLGMNLGFAYTWGACRTATVGCKGSCNDFRGRQPWKAPRHSLTTRDLNCAIPSLSYGVHPEQHLHDFLHTASQIVQGALSEVPLI